MNKLRAGRMFAMLPKNVPHYNVMRGETILRFHGIEPYDIEYVNPGYDPTRKSKEKP